MSMTREQLRALGLAAEQAGIQTPEELGEYIVLGFKYQAIRQELESTVRRVGWLIR